MRIKDYTQAIDKLRAEGHSSKEIVKGLKKFLSARNADYMLAEITKSYERYALHGYRPEVLKIETAHEVKKGTLDAIRLSAGVPESSRVMHVVDDRHIGGYRTLYNHVLTDATVETQLKKLHTKLLEI